MYAKIRCDFAPRPQLSKHNKSETSASVCVLARAFGFRVSSKIHIGGFVLTHLAYTFDARNCDISNSRSVVRK